MAKNLVIVESPSKAKTLMHYLGSGYKVVASKGHVRDLPVRRLSIDVKNDFEPKYEISPGKEKLVEELQSEVAKAGKVFLATDPDREGEAISWHLAYLLGLDLDEENRVTFNEITKTGVSKGMAAPRKVDLNVVNAQQARRILDRLVGYKLSPFVSSKIYRGLSAGRVQSVALKMIVDREKEIRAFVPKEYWTIEGKFLGKSKRVINASYFGDESGKKELKSEADVKVVLSRLDGASYTIDSVKKGSRKKQPLPPYITSTLQQDGVARLGFSSDKIMKVAQTLYEGVEVEGRGSIGLITYMRTDSLRVSEEARKATADFIKSNYGEKYLPSKPRYFKQRSGAQDGHEAIRPTTVSLTPDSIRGSLSNDQYKVYKLIWNRFVASMMAECVQSTVKLDIHGVGRNEKPGCFISFTASGYSVKFDGFTVLYDYSNDENSKIPEDVSNGEPVSMKSLTPNQHFTSPPPRYTEGSLIKALEENGVGRPSTYASIVSTINKREYIKKVSKALIPTELGEAISDLLSEKFSDIVNVKFTANMETELDEVSEGKEDYISLLHSFYDDFELQLKKAKEEMKGVKITLKEDETDETCEKCGKPMVIKHGRFGVFLACSGYPECDFHKPLVKETPGVCPKCGGRIIERRTKKGRVFFGCGNYPDCRFASWDAPTGETCPKCGKSLAKSRQGLIKCLNEDCDYSFRPARKKASKKDE